MSEAPRVIKPDLNRASVTLDRTTMIELTANEVVDTPSSRCHPFEIIMPYTKGRIMWDIGGLIALMYVAMISPFRIGFEADAEEGSFVRLLVDVAVNFRTAVNLPDGKLEIRSAEIARIYLRGYFGIDFLSSFPYELVIGSLANFQSAKVLKTGKILKVSRLFKLAKILRLMKLPLYFERFEESVSISATKIKMATIFLLMVTIAHIFACGWSYVARIDEDEFYVNSWVSKYGIAEESVGKQYVASLYWAFTTMTTVGYGDISPVTELEMIYCILVMLFGGGFYAYIIATLSSVVTNSDANKRLINERMDSINAYMTVRKFPLSLARKVRRYYRHYFELRTALDESNILQDLSPSIRNEVAIFLVDQTISANPLFKEMSPQSFSQLLTILYPIQIDPGEWLFQAGDHGEEMYIVISGQVQVVDSNDEVVAILSAGAYFGELCALGVSPTRTCGIQASEFCELYCLSKSDFFSNFAETEPKTIQRMIQLATNSYQDDDSEPEVKEAAAEIEDAFQEIPRIALNSPPLDQKLNELCSLIDALVARVDKLGGTNQGTSAQKGLRDGVRMEMDRRLPGRTRVIKAQPGLGAKMEASMAFRDILRRKALEAKSRVSQVDYPTSKSAGNSARIAPFLTSMRSVKKVTGN